MACFYCLQELHKPIQSVGQCVECVTKDVCIDPSGRPDKRFHAAECLCGNRELVCRYHVLDHLARAQHGKASDCFPSIVIAASTDVLGSASSDLGKGRTASQLSPKTVDHFNEFLNFVTPGYHALTGAIDRGRDSGVGELTTRQFEEETRIARLSFMPEFYAEGAIERVAALAASALGEAWKVQKGRKGGTGELAWLDDSVRKALGGIKFLRPLKTIYVERLLRSFMPEGAAVSPSLVRALSYTEVPTGAAAIADWMVSATQSVKVVGTLAEA